MTTITADKTTLHARYWEACEAWKALGIELLLSLDDRGLANVLLGVDRKDLERFLDAVGLQSLWKRSPSKAKAAEAVAPKLRDELDDLKETEGHEAIEKIAMSLLLTWWARGLETRLSGRAIWKELAGLQLRDRYGRARELLPNCAAEDAAALDTLPPSPTPEDRLFRLLARATIADWAEDDFREFETTAEMLRISARAPDEDGSPDDEPGRGQEDTGLDEHAHGLSPDVPVIAEPVAAPDAVGPAPVSAGAREGAVVPGLAEVRAAMSSCLLARREMQREAAAADIARLQGHIEKIARLEKDAIRAVQGFQLAAAIKAEPPPPAALAIDAEMEAFLARQRDKVVDRDRRTASHVEERRKELERDLVQIGLHAPKELAETRSVDEVDALRTRLEPAMRVEREVKTIAQFPERELSGELSVTERAEVVGRIAKTGAVRGVALLRLLLACELPQGHADAAAPLLDEALAQVLDGKESLPSGVWAQLVRGRGLEAAVALAEKAIVLAGGDETRIDAEGLRFLVGSQGPLSDDLQRAIQRVEFHGLTPVQRVERAAALVLEQDLDREYLQELATSLVDSGRLAEALALSVFELQAGIEPREEDQVTKNALLATLVERAADTPEAASIIRSLIADQRWLLGPDDLPVLLYLCDRVDAALPTPQAFPEQWRDAVEIRPALMQALVLPEQRMVAREEIEKASRALAELRHDMARRSCYTNWPPATDYQVAFNAYLANQLARLNQEDGLPLTADELIDRARTQGDLPPVIGKAMRAMRSYVEQQFERVAVLRRALAGEWVAPTPEEELARRGRDRRADLRNEAAGAANTPALRWLYRNVAEA